MRILIIGYGQDYHIGAHLLRAAIDLGIEVRILDASEAHSSSLAARQINWRLRGHRPGHLSAFSSKVLTNCIEYQPACVVVTGITAPDHRVVRQIRALGIKVVNYLTDDPWNPVHFAPWFIHTLPEYTKVFSPRYRNYEDLLGLGCSVDYLPFAYSEHVHFPEVAPMSLASAYESDVLFYGGADSDRIPVIMRLMDEGFRIHLYGGYWTNDRRFRGVAKGIASPEKLRWAVSGARITLCLVRTANRDGHSMRTYEAAALGACLLMEATEDHRAIFGDDFENAAFFASIDELVAKARHLLDNPTLSSQLKVRAHARIIQGPNTYGDRLQHMLASVM